MWHISVWGYPCIIAYQLRQKLRAWRLSESWRHGVAAPLPVRHQQWFSSLEEIHIVIRPLYNLTHNISLFILINLFHYTSFLEWAKIINIRTIENSIKALLLKKIYIKYNMVHFFIGVALNLVCKKRKKLKIIYKS